MHLQNVNDNDNNCLSNDNNDKVCPALTKLNQNDKRLLYTLRMLGLETLFTNFNINMINFNDLFLLTKEDLIEMNIPIGPRNRILNFAMMYKKHTRKYDMNELMEFFNEHKELNVCYDNNYNSNNNNNNSGANTNSNSNGSKHKCLNISLKSNTSMSLSKTTSANTTNCNSLCNNNNNNNDNNNNKHNSQIVRNFESLFSEVECFQQQYEHMKVKSTERNNKINKLLLKKNSHGNINKDKYIGKVDCNVLGNEKERDLNVELGKIYNGYYKHKSSRIKNNKVVFVDKYCDH